MTLNNGINPAAAPAGANVPVAAGAQPRVAPQRDNAAPQSVPEVAAKILQAPNGPANAPQPVAPFYKRVVPLVSSALATSRAKVVSMVQTSQTHVNDVVNGAANRYNTFYNHVNGKIVAGTDYCLGKKIGKIFRDCIYAAVIWVPANFIFKTWVTVAAVTVYGVIHVIYRYQKDEHGQIKPNYFPFNSPTTYKLIHDGFGWAGVVGAIRNIAQYYVTGNVECRTIAAICAAASYYFFTAKNEAPVVLPVVQQPEAPAAVVVPPAAPAAVVPPVVQQPAAPVAVVPPVVQQPPAPVALKEPPVGAYPVLAALPPMPVPSVTVTTETIGVVTSSSTSSVSSSSTSSVSASSFETMSLSTSSATTSSAGSPPSPETVEDTTATPSAATQPSRTRNKRRSVAVAPSVVAAAPSTDAALPPAHNTRRASSMRRV